MARRTDEVCSDPEAYWFWKIRTTAAFEMPPGKTQKVCIEYPGDAVMLSNPVSGIVSGFDRKKFNSETVEENKTW